MQSRKRRLINQGFDKVFLLLGHRDVDDFWGNAGRINLGNEWKCEIIFTLWPFCHRLQPPVRV